MTDEEINITIAKLCGWTDHCNIPDYCNDLNAMHEAERHIMDEASIEYVAFLKEHSCVWHSSARLRAEAFLRAWGKWEE